MMFSRRKRIFSRLDGRSFPRLSSAIRLAMLNNLSTSVEVGGGVRNFFASLQRALVTFLSLWCSSCLSQYLRQEIVSNGEFKYFFNSFSSTFMLPSEILFLSFRCWNAAASPSWISLDPVTSASEFCLDGGPS